jgi:hypothetical protein
VSQGSVALSSNAAVNGSIRTGGTVSEQTGVIVTGSIQQNQPVSVNSSIQIGVTFPSGTQPITLQPGASQTLIPGAYGNIIVNSRATLSLSSGTYTMTSLDVEPQATLSLNESAGPVVIYIQNTLLYKGTEAEQGGRGNVFFGVFGSQAVSLQAPFTGTVVAPNAELDLTSQTAGFAGAFFGNTVELFPGTTVTGIGAVIPGNPSGVAPTVNCVTNVDSTHLGAVFGYSNNTGANVTLGTGPHNFFSPGPADLGQPILFVPGQVPIATFQTFAASGHISLTVGQQSAIASSGSPACPASLGMALSQLFVPTSASKAVQQSVVGILSSPHFSAWMNTLLNNAPPLTSIQSAAADTARFVLANVDLLADPATLTSSQLARLPAFRSSLLGMPFVTALRLSGDALRANPSALPCGFAGEFNTHLPLPVSYAQPQPGSLYDQMLTFGKSSALATVESSVTGIVTNTATAAALLAAPGYALATFVSDGIDQLQLSGPIPTCDLICGLGNFFKGFLAGATAGAIAGSPGGPLGAVIGAVIGGVIGGTVNAADPNLGAMFLGMNACQQTCGSSQQCPPGQGCGSGCCVDLGMLVGVGQFMLGTGCSGNVPSCTRDDDCGGGGVICIDACCRAQSLISCPGSACESDADCSGQNHCEFGCCVGVCGFSGKTCDNVTITNACGGTPNACPSGLTCTDGCCQPPQQPPPT